jgi:hypothetical protein
MVMHQIRRKRGCDYGTGEETMTSRKSLLQLFRDNTGKTTVELKAVDPKTPYQTSRVQEYFMTSRRGN